MGPDNLHIEREIVAVSWCDASQSPARGDEHPIEQLGRLEHLYEVGWVLREDEETITIGLEHQEGMESARLWLTIPRCNIVELRRMQVDKAFPKSSIDKSYSPKPARRRKRT